MVCIFLGSDTGYNAPPAVPNWSAETHDTDGKS